MANKIFIKDTDAHNFTLKLADVMKITQWSRAKVYRLIGTKLNPVYLETDKNTQLFNENEVLAASGVIVAENAPNEPEPQTETAIATAENKITKRNSQYILKREKNNSQNLNIDFEAVFLLPHKKIKTLKEAAKISGLSLDFLKQFGVLTSSGYKFTNQMIDEAAENYIAFYRANPVKIERTPPPNKKK